MRNVFTPLVSLLCMLIATHATGQTPNTDCVGTMRGILTVPGTGSVNTEVPSKRNNTIFDWTASTYNVNCSRLSPNASTIASPFYQSDNVPINHFLDNKDMRPEDGWELIKKNLGYKDDGTAEVTDYVYLVLYNKYTAVLRVFFAGGTNGYNGTKITIRFISGNNVSGALSATTSTYALDQTDPQRGMAAVTGYNNDPLKWFYADFNMGYDPCTCVFESKMAIQLYLINNSVINITGTENGMLTNITNQSGTVAPDNRYSFKELGTEMKKAAEVYKDIDKFKTSLSKAEGVPANPTTPAQQEKAGIINTFQNALKSSSFLKAGLAAAPYVGAAVELLSFFTSGGKKSAGPQEVKMMPMALNSRIALEGTLGVTQNFKDVTFYTPGSKNSQSGSLDDYPYYNEILGVLNLIESPKMNYRTVVSHFETGTQGDPNYSVTDMVSNDFELLPASDGTNLSYVLNPAARFKSDKVEIFGKIQYGFTIPRQVITQVINGTTTPVDTIPPYFSVSFETEYLPMSSLTGINMKSGYQQTSDQYGTSYQTLGISDATPSEAILRLLINLERTDADANTQNVLMTLTYPITMQYNGTFDYSSAVDYASLPLDVVYTNYALQTVNMKAVKSITLGTGITTGSGVTVVYQAPSIKLSPGVLLSSANSSTINLKGGYIVPGGPVINAAATNTVKTFCASSSYTNHHPAARIAADDVASEDVDVNEDEVFRISPNPTSSFATANYSIEKETDVVIQFRDITGRLMSSFDQGRKPAGVHRAEFDVMSLSTGLYFIVLKTTEGSYTQKLMIQR